MSVEKKIAGQHIGPGGINCPCCGPAPGPKRKQFLRSMKKRAKSFFRKEIAKDVIEMRHNDG